MITQQWVDMLLGRLRLSFKPHNQPMILMIAGTFSCCPQDEIQLADTENFSVSSMVLLKRLKQRAPSLFFKSTGQPTLRVHHSNVCLPTYTKHRAILRQSCIPPCRLPFFAKSCCNVCLCALNEDTRQRCQRRLTQQLLLLTITPFKAA